jgi:hypothetical protein
MAENYKNRLNSLLEKLEDLDDLTWFYIFYEALKRAYPSFTPQELFNKLSGEQVEDLINLIDKVGDNYRLEKNDVQDKS